MPLRGVSSTVSSAASPAVGSNSGSDVRWAVGSTSTFGSSDMSLGLGCDCIRCGFLKFGVSLAWARLRD